MSVCQNHKFLLFSLSNIQSLFYLFVSCAVKLLFQWIKYFDGHCYEVIKIFHVIVKNRIQCFDFCFIWNWRLSVNNWCLFKLLPLSLFTLWFNHFWYKARSIPLHYDLRNLLSILRIYKKTFVHIGKLKLKLNSILGNVAINDETNHIHIIIYITLHWSKAQVDDVGIYTLLIWTMERGKMFYIISLVVYVPLPGSQNR